MRYSTAIGRLAAVGTALLIGTGSVTLGQSGPIVREGRAVMGSEQAGEPTAPINGTVSGPNVHGTKSASDDAGWLLGSTGPDVIIGDLQSVLRFGRVGHITAYSAGTNVCNIGDERVSYVHHTNAHPICVQGLFRLKDGQFEQIGMGWVYHPACGAVSQSLCSPCLDPTDLSELGVGCSNPESAWLHGVQSNLSLRSVVNAHTGYFPYPWWEAPEPEEIIGRRIQVHDDDIDPALNYGASYFVQGHYITADDAAAGNGNNNASYRPVTVVVNPFDPPNTYNVVATGLTQRERPAIRAWKDTDSSVVETDVQVPGEGLFILAGKATKVGDGFWHYEYALQNLNSDRSARSFTVPISLNAVVRDVGFHDVDYHSGEIYDSTNWAATVRPAAITWETDRYDDDPNANALRFGTLYNFRFDADVEPESTTITIGLFRPGYPHVVAAETMGPLGRSTGPDIITGDLQSALYFGRVGEMTAYGVGTDPCNVGDERVSWIANTNAHPVWVQGMFRLKDGRFEQIGMSWVRHGFYAVSQSLCGPCLDPADGSQLGVGCSGCCCSAYLNGLQTNLSLRSDVNAHTGYFPYPWQAPEAEETIGRRVQVQEANVDPDLNEGALYFVEAHHIAADDAAAGNGNNNASYRPVGIEKDHNDAYEVDVTGITQREQPAIRAWKDHDSSVIETDVQVPDEGLFILAAQATWIGGGFWHYEYALQNLNSDRSAGSLTVPIPVGALVRNVGFHDVDYHSGEIYDLTDWSGTVQDDAITWTTDSYDDNPNANALRFATLYNFRFDTNIPPGAAVATIGLFKPGSPSEVQAGTVGPSLAPLDCNENGVDDRCDIACGKDCDPPCGQSVDCNDNNIPDECEPDCNANGIADECDIASALSNDCNENTIPDECEPDCDNDGIPDECDTFEDTDGDGIFDCFDLCPLTTPQGACVCPDLCECCWPSGYCVDDYPCYACIPGGGVPDCIETPCRDGCLIGDYDGDGDRDLRDWAGVQRCYTGGFGTAGYVSPSSECTLRLDFDQDDDIDLGDFQEWGDAYAGPK